VSDSLPATLCHPDGKKSCGACCGLYNHVAHDERATWERLRQRTRAFFEEACIDDEGSLTRFREKWEDGPEDKLLTGLRSCPFLGFIEESRVGCLVHPLQNDGVDGRDCGIYDRFICEDYLCAAHDVLRRSEIRLVLNAVGDSYLYGLAVTNPKFVRKLLELVADRTGTLPGDRVLRRPEVIAAAAQCFELMRDWPYRAEDGIFGQVEVAGELDTTRRRMPAEVLGVDEEPVDVLLVCMGTRCETIEELHEARRIVGDAVARLAEAAR
jgi:hypothetical protein